MYDTIYKTRHGFVIPNEHIPSDDDMRRYAEKDLSVVNELVEGLTGYIVNSVEWFLTNTPTAQPFTEDCKSEALLTLVTFVNNKVGTKYTPQHFMSAAKMEALNTIKDWLREMSVTVTVPARSAQRNDLVFIRRRLTGDVSVTDNNPVFERAWFTEFMELLDDFDKRLVALRMDGQTDRQIGRAIGMEHRHVANHLRRLAELYLEGEL
jgi:hypothetical protein